MNDNIRNKIRGVLNEEFGIEQRELTKLVTVLNALEFKPDINAAGGEIYAVGGIVRDAIMGTPGDDLDIVVRGVPYEQLFAILSKYGTATDTSHEKEDGDKDFGSTIFVSNNQEFNEFLTQNGIALDIDVMLPRKDAKDPNVKGHKGIKSDVNPNYTIHDDLERRDITINAIAMDGDGNLISKGTGLEDIKRGVIKAVNEDAFIEDPLRMLRAVRFAARYDYQFDPGTINLIRNNASLLSDKQELPKERFLKEFNKMIGKADLARAVRLFIDLGMYKHMFGIEPAVNNVDAFKRVENIGDFAYMMFENEPLENIVGLIRNNITNDNSILEYAKALVEYHKTKKFAKSDLEKVILMAKVYKTSPQAANESIYIDSDFSSIIDKFKSGELPKNDHDLKFKGEEFKEFVIDIIKEEEDEFVPKRDGVRMGRAKSVVLHNIYDGNIKNKKEEIKNFLDEHRAEWMD